MIYLPLLSAAFLEGLLECFKVQFIYSRSYMVQCINMGWLEISEKNLSTVTESRNHFLVGGKKGYSCLRYKLKHLLCYFGFEMAIFLSLSLFFQCKFSPLMILKSRFYWWLFTSLIITIDFIQEARYIYQDLAWFCAIKRRNKWIADLQECQPLIFKRRKGKPTHEISFLLMQRPVLILLSLTRSLLKNFWYSFGNW